MFPHNASYGHQSTAYCVDRSTVKTSSHHCWIEEETIPNDNTSCQTFSSDDITTLSVDNSSIYEGTSMSSCPNQFSWLAMVALIMYIVSFASGSSNSTIMHAHLIHELFLSYLGMGPVPWTVNAEIYPNWSRSIGTSASTTTNWLSNLLVSLTFLHLTRYLTRYGAFSFYMFLATCGWIFIFLLLPETKGQTLEEVEGLFKGRLCPPPGLSKRKPH